MICPLRGCKIEYDEEDMVIHFLNAHRDKVSVKEDTWTGLEKAAWDAVHAEQDEKIIGNFELDCFNCKGQTLSAANNWTEGRRFFFCPSCDLKVWLRPVKR